MIPYQKRLQKQQKIGRRDMRDFHTVTIDGEDARDLDDAISLTFENGIYHLGVHIADVTHYVKEGSLLDEEAKKSRHKRVFGRSCNSDASKRAFKWHMLFKCRDRSLGFVMPDGYR